MTTTGDTIVDNVTVTTCTLGYVNQTLQAYCVVTPNEGVIISSLLIQAYTNDGVIVATGGGGNSVIGQGNNDPMQAAALTDFFPPSLGQGLTLSTKVQGETNQGTFRYFRDFTL